MSSPKRSDCPQYSVELLYQMTSTSVCPFLAQYFAKRGASPSSIESPMKRISLAVVSIGARQLSACVFLDARFLVFNESAWTPQGFSKSTPKSRANGAVLISNPPTAMPSCQNDKKAKKTKETNNRDHSPQ